MNLNIDFFIVTGFLLLTLVVGLSYGKKVRNIKDYALGGRNFSTIALVSTIVATQASGSNFLITLANTYTDGFYEIASLGIGVSIVLTSIILVSRMQEFLGKLSIAEAMGDIYGQKIRLITAITGTIRASGFIAVQFKVFAGILSYLLNMQSYLTIIIGGCITTIYSAFGGIRSVTFTDVLQGFTFGVITPLLGFTIWSQFYHMDYSIGSILNDPKFNIKLLYDTSNYNFWNCIFLFILFSIPVVSVPTFQRISMGSNIEQIKKSFIIAA